MAKQRGQASTKARRGNRAPVVPPPARPAAAATGRESPALLAGPTTAAPATAAAPERAARRGPQPDRVLWAGLALLPGLAVFLLLYRQVLDPHNIDWLFSPNSLTTDASTSELGWLYYAADSWRLPLGSNPNYGGNIADGLMFSDSVPIFAFVMKVVFTVLRVDGPTQLLGLNLLTCLLLQSAFGFALLRAWRASRGVALGGAAILSLAPSLMYNWPITSLSWQWPLLACVLLVSLPLDVRRRVLWWSVLLFVTTGLTPYMTAMTVVLGSLDVLVRAWPGRSWRRGAVSLAVMAATTMFGFWLWGVFNIGLGASVGSGLGDYSATTTALLDPGAYSLLVHDLPGGTGNGYSYVGAGVLVLGLLALGQGLRRLSVLSVLQARTAAVRAIRAHRPLAVLVLGCLALALFSLLPAITVGTHSVRVPFPDRVYVAMATFRANGRFMWPLMYLAVAAAVLVGSRTVVRGRQMLVVAVLILQVLDVSVFVSVVRAQVKDALSQAPRFQPQLDAALGAPGVERVEVVPAYPYPLDVPFREVGLSAYRAGLPLLSVGYLNRYDTAAILELRAEQTARLQAGDLAPDTVYVLQRPLYDQYLAQRPDVQRLIDIDAWVVVRVAGSGSGPAPVLGPQPAASPAS